MATIVIIIALLGIARSAPTYNNGCIGDGCKRFISMPLIDHLKATLKADVDVSEMNNYLQDFMQREVQTGIQSVMKDIIAEIVNNRSEIANRITALFKDAKEQSDDYLAKKLTDFEATFERKDRQRYAFLASLSQSKTDTKDESILIFDQVSLNTGNSYNRTTGKFTCHHDGIYSFSWTILSDSKRDFNSALVLDGQRIAHNIVDNDKVDDAMTGSTTVVVAMKAGQSVWIYAVNNAGNKVSSSFNGKSKVTVFSGFMI